MKNEFEILKVKETVHGLIELRSDEILVFRPDIATFKEYNLQVLKELHIEFVEITDGKPIGYLCDNRFITGIVNKEEQVFINDNFGDFATSAAMITDSQVIKILVNGYTSFFKPKVKIKLFSTEKAALRWLRNSNHKN